jgi:hypothetical protein
MIVLLLGSTARTQVSPSAIEALSSKFAKARDMTVIALANREGGCSGDGGECGGVLFRETESDAPALTGADHQVKQCQEKW